MLEEIHSEPRGALELQGRIAVVTCGAKGIGEATCRLLAAQGFVIAIIDRDESAAEETAKSLPSAMALAGDVGDYNRMKELVDGVEDEMGPISVLVNNAGWDRVRPFLSNPHSLWADLLRSNLMGLFNLTQTVADRMTERGAGHIVNVASDAGRVGSWGEAAYSACKGGTIAFTKSTARTVARHGVAVNCVCPGPTPTPLLDEIKQNESAAKVTEAIIRATPMPRVTSHREVADTIAYFASCPPQVTGQVVSGSGGLTLVG
ncbi:SDR family NAD(P)-dependent oxidoreductase [Streptomyces sp. NPDC002516]